MQTEVMEVNTLEEVIAIEERVKARELSRHDFEIACDPGMAIELFQRPFVEEEETGWSQWGYSGRVTSGLIVMRLRWVHDPSYYSRYDTPLTRYDELNEIGDLESDENSHAGDW
jgi:hypothetical protein